MNVHDKVVGLLHTIQQNINRFIISYDYIWEFKLLDLSHITFISSPGGVLMDIFVLSFVSAWGKVVKKVS